MEFIPQMKRWQKFLTSNGFKVKVPHLVNHRMSRHPLAQIKRLKKTEALGHFQRISKSDAILVLNYDKGGITNYIGGAAFGEIAVAFHLGKMIFLLNPMPSGLPYSEELSAWGVRIWNGPRLEEGQT